MGNISEYFQVKTGLRFGDALSPILFNLILDKITKTLWEMNDIVTKIGFRNRSIKVSCLVFADDLILFAEWKEETVAQIVDLTEIAQKADLQISFTIT